MLGEMVNLQKVNWPKCQLAKKVNLLKTPNIAFWSFYAQVDFWQVDFLVSWLFGGWPFLLVSWQHLRPLNSLEIITTNQHFSHSLKNQSFKTSFLVNDAQSKKSYIGMIFWTTEKSLNLINNFDFHQALRANISINELHLMKLFP